MFASLQTLQRPNGMGPHGLLGLSGLGGDWVQTFCTDSNGKTGVPCDYSAAYGEAWDDRQCDPEQSHASGVCTDADGFMIPGVPAVSFNANTSMVNSGTAAQQAALVAALNSGTSSPFPAATAALKVTTQPAGTANPLANTTGLPSGTGAPASTVCAKTLMPSSGICDSTLYIGLAVFGIILVVATKR